MSGDEQVRANIREILGPAIGLRLIDITQHDPDDFQETGMAYVMLMFEDGTYMKFYIQDAGFEHNCENGEDETRKPENYGKGW